jgi:hypothetical protein
MIKLNLLIHLNLVFSHRIVLMLEDVKIIKGIKKMYLYLNYIKKSYIYYLCRRRYFYKGMPNIEHKVTTSYQ